ncbi:MAG: hypothetical protein WCS37_20715 [Chloroflexota bacterium]|nr:hypothetical protein [Chloroflexota bacterium]
MTYLQELQQELFYLIAPSGFAGKYYHFYEAHSEVQRESGLAFDFDHQWIVPPERLADMLEETLLASGLDFKFSGAGDFFESLEKFEGLEIGLKVALHNSKIEFMLVLKTTDRRIEWPFWGLAAEIELLRDADFEYFPRNPKLPVSSPETLAEAVNFGVTLYNQVKGLILSHHQGWTLAVSQSFWNQAAA